MIRTFPISNNEYNYHFVPFSPPNIIRFRRPCDPPLYSLPPLLYITSSFPSTASILSSISPLPSPLQSLPPLYITSTLPSTASLLFSISLLPPLLYITSSLPSTVSLLSSISPPPSPIQPPSSPLYHLLPPLPSSPLYYLLPYVIANLRHLASLFNSLHVKLQLIYNS